MQDMVRYMWQQDMIQYPVCLRSKSQLIRSICLDDATGLKRQGLLVSCPIGGLNLQVDGTRDILINPLRCTNARFRPGVDTTEGICPAEGQHQNDHANRRSQDSPPVETLQS